MERRADSTVVLVRTLPRRPRFGPRSSAGGSAIAMSIPVRCFFGLSPRALLELSVMPCCSKRRTKLQNV
jgi:hypothetical protein